jgi:hypothetical protein
MVDMSLTWYIFDVVNYLGGVGGVDVVFPVFLAASYFLRIGDSNQSRRVLFTSVGA